MGWLFWLKLILRVGNGAIKYILVQKEPLVFYQSVLQCCNLLRCIRASAGSKDTHQLRSYIYLRNDGLAPPDGGDPRSIAPFTWNPPALHSTMIPLFIFLTDFTHESPLLIKFWVNTQPYEYLVVKLLHRWCPPFSDCRDSLLLLSSVTSYKT